MAKDKCQQHRPALGGGPSLRNGFEAAQRIADLRDPFDQRLPILVLQTDFDRLLSTMADQTAPLRPVKPAGW